MDSETREFYDKIAESWYNIRHRTIFWSELFKLNESWHGSILNIGCAHGADFIPFNPDKFHFFGLDNSKELVLLSKKYSDKFGLFFHNLVSDMRSLPFQDSSFDYVICIASLHHLLQKEDRLRVLKEIKRVLRKEAFLTVWNRENPNLPNEKIIEKNWKYGNQVLKRPYYLYDKEELEKEIKEAGLSARVWSDDRNIMALLKLK